MEEGTPRWQYSRQRLRDNMKAAHGGRKDEIDVLRTAFWFAEIKARLQVPTAYKIERLLESNAFGKNKDGDHIHRNKWPKYEVGQHVPSDALATEVEEKLPGTKRLLNHVLWSALQGKTDANNNFASLLRQLAPDIQKIIFHVDHHTPDGNSRRNSLSSRHFKMLERRAGIDALACLTILARESCLVSPAKILDIGTSLYRVLLILCTTVQFGDFALELLDIYRKRIYELLRHQGSIFHIEDSDFLDAVDLLRSLVLSLEDNGQIGLGWNDTTQAMHKLLDGAYGFDIQFALAPLIGPVEPLTDINVKDYADFERKKRFRQWGKEQIFSKNRQALPPKELW